MAEAAGIEPANMGAKIPCLNRLATPLYGAGNRNRTRNLLITNQLLCLLSYSGVKARLAVPGEPLCPPSEG